MSGIVQRWYSVPELAWTFGFSESSIRAWIRAGEFGDTGEFLVRGTDVRIPQAAVVAWQDRHLVKHDASRRIAMELRGRSVGEARRKLQAAEVSQAI